MNCDNEKIWFQDVRELTCSTSILPKSNDNVNQKLNSITRLSFIIFIIILIFDTEKSLYFLLGSIIIIYFSYIKLKKENFINNKTMNLKENFIKKQHGLKVSSNDISNDIENPQHKLSNNFYCDPKSKVSVSPDTHESRNANYRIDKANNLDCNPKTKINPILPPRITDLDVWRNNNMVKHSHLNETTNFDNYNSGYTVSDCNPNSDYNPNSKSVSFGENILINSRENTISSSSSFEENMEFSGITEGYEMNKSKVSSNSEGYEYNSNLQELYDINNMELNHNGEILLSQGYSEHPSIANNNSKSFCGMNNDNLFEHNSNINTQRINYDSAVHSEIIEPINSNIGISFTQQHPHVQKLRNEEGNVIYEEKDPVGLEYKDAVYCEGVNESNVYDPRQNGYGTTYRAYVDERLGQPKFFYDDVNNIRNPSYISRNNIDHLNYAPKYDTEDNTQLNGVEMQKRTNDSYLNSTNDFRNDLQYNLLRKMNARKYQLREMPLLNN